jgi:osmotically-inducible protein OsmY
MHRSIADSLEIEGPAPGRDITVRVEHGWVSLSGQVTSTADYSAIERALECVAGVRGVTSEVHIADAGKPPTVAQATH